VTSLNLISNIVYSSELGCISLFWSSIISAWLPPIYAKTVVMMAWILLLLTQ
jgi:hypothetical protein